MEVFSSWFCTPVTFWVIRQVPGADVIVHRDTPTSGRKTVLNFCLSDNAAPTAWHEHTEGPMVHELVQKRGDATLMNVGGSLHSVPNIKVPRLMFQCGIDLEFDECCALYDKGVLFHPINKENRGLLMRRYGMGT